jgi:FlgN protein
METPAAEGFEGGSMALSDVSNILWRERQLLELLVFKLEEEQLVLAAGRSRWLSHATREVEIVRGEIRRIELERAIHVADAGRELGLSGAPTLEEFASLTPPPWEGIFAEHRRALLALAEGGARFESVEDMDGPDTSESPTMNPSPSDVEDADSAEVMMNLRTQQGAYQAALQATARAIHPSLADFLR